MAVSDPYKDLSSLTLIHHSTLIPHHHKLLEMDFGAGVVEGALVIGNRFLGTAFHLLGGNEFSIRVGLLLSAASEIVNHTLICFGDLINAWPYTIDITSTFSPL